VTARTAQPEGADPRRQAWRFTEIRGGSPRLQPWKESDTTAYLAIHGARGNFLGYIANDDPDAVAWLVSLFDGQYARGRSLAAYYDDPETAVDPR
jgi:hypothetical protein